MDGLDPHRQGAAARAPAAAYPFVPREYAGRNAPEPFSQTKIGDLNRVLSESPEAGRRREPLEDFPLENFKMLGPCTSAAKPTASSR